MITLHSYQKDGVDFITKSNGRACVSYDLGLGKTAMALWWNQHRKPEKGPMVVVCPASVKWQWQSEAKKHFGIRADVLEGRKPKNGGDFGWHGKVVILNYDILPNWIEWLKGTAKPNLVVLDEAQLASNPSTKRGRGVIELCEGIPHVLVLTGTPIMNRVLDFWLPLHVLKPKRFPTLSSFGHQFCSPKRNRFGQWEFKGSSNVPLLRKKIADCVIRRLKSDVMKDLPPKTRTMVPFELPDRKQYDAAAHVFSKWLGDRRSSELTRDERMEGWGQLGMLKKIAAELKLPLVMDWLRDFFESSGGKIIVFGFHRSILEALHARWERSSVLIYGGIGGRKRQNAVDHFQTSKKCRLAVCNVKSAGMGLNLDAATTEGFAELWWNPAVHEQAEARAYRPAGNLHPVSVYYWTAMGTCETVLAKIIQRKAATTSDVLDGGKGDRMRLFDMLAKETTRIGGRKWKPRTL